MALDCLKFLFICNDFDFVWFFFQNVIARLLELFITYHLYHINGYRNYNPSIKIMVQFISHHLFCVYFIFFKVDSERQIFEKLYRFRQFYLLSEFLPEESGWRNIF